MLFCGQANQAFSGFELYHLYTGEWRAVVPDPGIVSYGNNCPGGTPYCGSGVMGFGADWIEWEEHCRYCDYTYLFQNIDTGKVQTLPGWRVGGRITPDLDSPSLAHRLCPPLTAPADPPPIPGAKPEIGSLSLYGWFAIASSGTGDVLERCGSKHKVAIGSDNEPVGASSHAIVWAAGSNSHKLDGLFLPSLRRFVIATGPSISPRNAVLSSRELYVIGRSGQVLATPAPTQPTRLTPATRHN